MAYCTVTDVLAAWPRVHTSGLVNDEIRTMIDRADSIIDGYLAVRYTVPFQSEPNSPPLIKTLSTDLALLDVFNRMPNTPDWIRDRLTRAFEMLKMLAEGTMVIPGVEVGERIRTSTEQYVPVFGAVPSLDERYDPNRADDEAGSRE